MISLALDSSAKTASTALLCDGRLLCEQYTNNGLTHSETLVPMVQNTLQAARLTMRQVDLLVVTNGPGSFTGVRIGIAAAKGLAMPHGTPCVGVSTLEAMAYNLLGQEGIACCMMDARCGQVYCALFRCERGAITRLTADKALPAQELSEQLQPYEGERICLLGDGAALYYDRFAAHYKGCALAPEHLLYQRACGAAFAQHATGTMGGSAEQLQPAYLRLPQAERELRRKEEDIK